MQGQGRLSELTEAPSLHPNRIAKWMDAQVRGVPVIWVRGGLGRLLEHGTFELDFEGCVEVSWKGSRDLDKG